MNTFYTKLLIRFLKEKKILGNPYIKNKLITIIFYEGWLEDYMHYNNITLKQLLLSPSFAFIHRNTTSSQLKWEGYLSQLKINGEIISKPSNTWNNIVEKCFDEFKQIYNQNDISTNIETINVIFSYIEEIIKYNLCKFMRENKISTDRLFTCSKTSIKFDEQLTSQWVQFLISKGIDNKIY